MNRTLLPVLGGLAGVSLGLLSTGSHTAGPIGVSAIVQRVNGSLVSDLAIDDFEVLIGGTSAQVIGVSTGEPASILLLVDTSASALYDWRFSPGRAFGPWSGRDLSGLGRRIAVDLASALRRGDRVRVGRFAGRTLRLDNRFTSSPDELTAAITATFRVEAIEPREFIGPSPIWDIVEAASRELSTEPGIRAILLITDGESTGNRWSVADAAALAAVRRVAVHPVFQKRQGVLNPELGTGDRLLRQLAELSGGMFWADARNQPRAWTDSDPDPPIRQILDAIHGSYVLQLRRDGLGTSGRWPLEVRVRPAGHLVHFPRWIELGDQ